MKNILKYLIFSLIFSVFMFGRIPFVYADNTTCEIVIDQESGRVLFSNNEKVKRGMASTTKVLTCITAIEHYDLNKRIKIKKEWTGIEGSSIYLKEGEEFTVKELLYALMLRSGNDVAVTLASALTGKAEDFVALMNQTALNIGAYDSSFKNPHGLDEDGHYTTAYDLALITRYALNNPTFCDIVNTKKVTIGQGESVRLLINKNKMLSQYQYATGVKTGYTKKTGRCLVSSADKNGHKLICVVLNCGPMYERSIDLFEKSYELYDRVLVLDKERAVGSLTYKNKPEIPVYVKNDIFYPLTKEEQACLEIKLIPYKNLEISSKFAEECGTIEIFLKKQLLFREKIYTIIE
ncbi:MAG: D-alanyl-D-alanine carboxypeptidase [Clostridia bacterium]|nr:D-alanyl-D-alanine carboxypeptidase [Clostridia bacterium]